MLTGSGQLHYDHFGGMDDVLEDFPAGLYLANLEDFSAPALVRAERFHRSPSTPVKQSQTEFILY